jgi:hypothetical protein
MSARIAQRGATLIVGLVMLILLTLLGMAAVNTSTSYFKIIGNMQYQSEAMAAAQSAINQVLSRGTYFLVPTSAPSTIDVDINGDGNADYPAAITRPCVLSVVAITIGKLNSLSPSDKTKCQSTAVCPHPGLVGYCNSLPSDCATVKWKVTATITDDFTSARAEITEGTSVRMDRIVAEAYRSDPARRCSS